MRRLTPIAVLLALGTLVAAPAVPPAGPAGRSRVGHVHIGCRTGWEGGRLAAPERSAGPALFVDRFSFDIKGSLRGKVRMETPVLSLLLPRETTVSVQVRFRQGVVTEWFPPAVVTPARADDTSIRRPDFAAAFHGPA